MSSNKEIVSKLAEKFGFDADEALAYITETPDVAEKSAKTETDKIAECKKNIALWEQKLVDGKVKDADKQREKIEKEKKKLAKLESKASDSEGEEKPAPKPAKKEKKVKDSTEDKPEKTEKPKKEKKSEEKSEDVKEKRIKRFTPVMSAQLKTALEGVGLDLSDKIKKEFQKYIEELSDDDYRKDGLADHMRAFAKANAPEEMPPLEKESDESEPEPETEKKETKKDPEVLGLADLQKISVLSAVEPTGTYWDADNGRFVTGPSEDSDEDMAPIKFEKKSYVVGEKTGRVYEEKDSGDVFAGFIGVGNFKKMKMPKTE